MENLEILRGADQFDATNYCPRALATIDTLNEQILLAMHKACLQADYLRQVEGR